MNVRIERAAVYSHFPELPKRAAIVIDFLTSQFRPWAAPAFGTPMELDLGCGKGSFTIKLAERYPDRLILGADVMVGRVRRLARQVERRGIPNMRVLRTDAWELVARHLPDASLLRAHVICPDPWPKSKHRGNRLVTSEFLGRLATKIVQGGTLHLATDDLPYRDFMLQAIGGMAIYTRDDSLLADIADITSDFERHWAAVGTPTHHYGFRRA
jgi:tRNA (guanine-N7-)-methyltransferase